MLVGLVLATAGAPVGTPVPAANRSSTPGSTTAAPTGSAGAGSVLSRPSTDDPTSAARSRTTAPASAAPAAEGAADSADPFSAASSPGTSTEWIRPDDTPRPAVAAQPSIPVPPTGPVPCTNAMLAAAAELENPVHRVGSRPVLRLVITNVSGQPCVRDLDAARQEIVVWSADGVDRLWSSNDCTNTPTIDLRTLVPGRPRPPVRSPSPSPGPSAPRSRAARSRAGSSRRARTG